MKRLFHIFVHYPRIFTPKKFWRNNFGGMMDFLLENMSFSYALRENEFKFLLIHTISLKIYRYSGDIKMYLLEEEKSENFGHYQREMYT